MKITILGASSYLGARIYQDLKFIDKISLSGTYFGNKLFSELEHLDVTNAIELEVYLTREKPNIIIHCASNANAKRCSEHPEQAKLLNITSTKNLVRICESIRCSLIYISSIAFYFDSLYGESKRKSEGFITNSSLQYLILRPSLILGSSPNTLNDRLHNRFLKTLENDTPTEYDNSRKFEPTYIGDISGTIIQCINSNTQNKIFEITSPFITTRYEIGVRLIKENLILKYQGHSSDPCIISNQVMRNHYNINTLSENEFVNVIKNELMTQLDKYYKNKSIQN